MTQHIKCQQNQTSADTQVMGCLVVSVHCLHPISCMLDQPVEQHSADLHKGPSKALRNGSACFHTQRAVALCMPDLYLTFISPADDKQCGAGSAQGLQQLPAIVHLAYVLIVKHCCCCLMWRKSRAVDAVGVHSYALKQSVHITAAVAAVLLLCWVDHVQGLLVAADCVQQFAW